MEERNGVGDAESSRSVQPGEGKVKKGVGGVWGGVCLITVLTLLMGEERQEMDSFLEAPRDRAVDNSPIWST